MLFRIAGFERGLFGAAALLLVSAVPAVAQTVALPSTITVSGHGESSAAPDLMTVRLAVVSDADTAVAALAENNQRVDQVLTNVRDAGIAAKDVRTADLSIQPRYAQANQGNGPLKLVGYEVTHAIEVRVRSGAKVDRGLLLDSLVNAGANRIDGITFDLSDPKKELEAARQAAIGDAHQTAETLTKAAGATLGPVLSIDETTAAPPPRPIMRAMVAPKLESVPIAPGETSITADVTVVFALHPGSAGAPPTPNP